MAPDGCDGARLEHHPPVPSRTVTCSQARRDGYPVGSLWPVRFRTATSSASVADPIAARSDCGDGRGVRLQLPHGRARGGFELAGKAPRRRARPIPVQHPQHEEVAAEERVPAQSRSRLAEHRGHRRRLDDRRACDTTGSSARRGRRCAATRDTAPARAATRRPRPRRRALSCRACGTWRTSSDCWTWRRLGRRDAGRRLHHGARGPRRPRMVRTSCASAVARALTT